MLEIMKIRFTISLDKNHFENCTILKGPKYKVCFIVYLKFKTYSVPVHQSKLI